MTAPAPHWLSVQVTPPDLAAGSMQEAELGLLSQRQRDDPGGRLDPETVAELRGGGWLGQDIQARGAYLSTSGLSERLGHPELVALNVPGAAVYCVANTLNEMASYLDGAGESFCRGELYAAGEARFTFDELGDDAATSIGFSSDRGFLVVIPLP